VTGGTGTRVTCPVGWVSANIWAGIDVGLGMEAVWVGGVTAAPGTMPSAELSTLPAGAAGSALAIAAG